MEAVTAPPLAGGEVPGAGSKQYLVILYRDKNAMVEMAVDEARLHQFVSVEDDLCKKPYYKKQDFSVLKTRATADSTCWKSLAPMLSEQAGTLLSSLLITDESLFFNDFSQRIFALYPQVTSRLYASQVVFIGELL